MASSGSRPDDDDALVAWTLLLRCAFLDAAANKSCMFKLCTN